MTPEAVGLKSPFSCIDTHVQSFRTQASCSTRVSSMSTWKGSCRIYSKMQHEASCQQQKAGTPPRWYATQAHLWIMVFEGKHTNLMQSIANLIPTMSNYIHVQPFHIASIQGDASGSTRGTKNLIRPESRSVKGSVASDPWPVNGAATSQRSTWMGHCQWLQVARP